MFAPRINLDYNTYILSTFVIFSLMQSKLAYSNQQNFTKHEPIKRTIQLEVVEGALLAADSTGITGWTQDVCRRGWVGEGRRGAPQSRGQQALEPPSSYEQVFQITKHVTQRVLSL